MIALASDHAGFRYKEAIKTILETRGIVFKDFGTYSDERSDYPDFAHAASAAVSRGECERGILVCGTGIGVGIVANKHTGVRAAMCQIPEAARLSRLHNNANILTIGGRLMNWETARTIVEVFLDTEFEGGRHIARIEKIHKLTSL